ncbi:protein of unknown function (DUF397) [Micromonospora matsumotoense]|uniref:DUF397 domain-containing protein n=1 Tax=Micromonospora matsumotoense TaxID=121616 RepID=A0A1C4VB47_9ACTN|nr:DUF397 domain-containing protein [Micromonospora matsumotoense]SCE81051.1 protein of unknown function (DUF397) [Micromonospora matsumotoense]
MITPSRDWFKSSRSSDNANCVEVRFVGAEVGVRDSKDRSGPTPAFAAASWASFTQVLRLPEVPRS